MFLLLAIYYCMRIQHIFTILIVSSPQVQYWSLINDVWYQTMQFSCCYSYLTMRLQWQCWQQVAHQFYCNFYQTTTTILIHHNHLQDPSLLLVQKSQMQKCGNYTRRLHLPCQQGPQLQEGFVWFVIWWSYYSFILILLLK